ncbi:MAG TPA: hypothetical protein VGN13_06225 [Solirubrobacteraceae bacterium]|jgi:glycosyltransferase involved in cell wall biosynthesis
MTTSTDAHGAPAGAAPLAQPPGGAHERRLSVAVVGMSTAEICGVRDHARLLADAMAAEGVACSLHWLDRSEPSLRGARSEVRSWAAGVAEELAERAPDAILLHYSVFAFSYRGIPLFASPTLSALRRGQAPLLTVLHESAYNWGWRGARSAVWALTQRAALVAVVRRSAAVLVTAERRARWLASRRWLPGRPTAVAPVFSNLPLAPAGAQALRGSTVGLFGYAHEGSEPALVLDSLRLLADRGVAARLLLLGAPGPVSAAGRRWQSEADARGLGAALEFTGTLPAGELSAALSSCAVLLFADTPGPSSRKTALAAALASARPVLALDGPRSWPALVDARAALIVEPRPEAIAGALRRLLASEELRRSQALRGRRFYEQTMSVEHSARAVAGLLDLLIAPPRR